MIKKLVISSMLISSLLATIANAEDATISGYANIPGCYGSCAKNAYDMQQYTQQQEQNRLQAQQEAMRQQQIQEMQQQQQRQELQIQQMQQQQLRNNQN